MMMQGSLLFPVKDEIPDSVIANCKDFKGAIRLCIESSGLERKEVGFALNLQDAHLSRMLSDVSGSDERHFPVNLLQKLMTACANDVPLRWLAMQRGFGLYRLKTELEMENEKLRSELEERKKEHETMLKVFRELKG
jgi:hypothetical protein